MPPKAGKPKSTTFVRVLRDLTGLTQDDFAARIGAHGREQVARWETTNSRPSAKYLDRMERLWPDQWAKAKGKQPNGIPHPLNTIESVECATIIDSIPEKAVRERIVVMVNNFAAAYLAGLISSKKPSS